MWFFIASTYLSLHLYISTASICTSLRATSRLPLSCCPCAAGSDPALQDKDGSTALHHLVDHSHPLHTPPVVLPLLLLTSLTHPLLTLQMQQVLVTSPTISIHHCNRHTAVRVRVRVKVRVRQRQKLLLSEYKALTEFHRCQRTSSMHRLQAMRLK